MKSFYNLDDYTIQDIENLIFNQVEESIYLDFKSAEALEKSEKKRADISKDVASFANSDGGIIVYGVVEQNHVASQFAFIDGEVFTKEWIEQIINSSIQRHITGIKIYPVRQDGDLKKTIYVVKIPASVDAPHLSRDNRFYKRYNFMSVPMEEYEVRQTYGRKNKTKLLINNWYLSDRRQRDDDEWKIVHLAVQAKNIANTIESNYKVNIFFKNVSDLLSFEWDRNETNFNSTNISIGYWKITATGKEPIFAQEIVNVLHLKLLLKREQPIEAITGVVVTIELLYSNGEHLMEFDLLEEYNTMLARYATGTTENVSGRT